MASFKSLEQGSESDICYDDMEVFQKPMCLVSTDENNVLKIETETIKQIAKIERPIVVVSIVGTYRTGKSYLMNRIAGSAKGFLLGDTIQPTTKGIWVWCKSHTKTPDTVLMLLDTEGLGDVEKGDPSHDNKIFTVATLLCNCLLYNMRGAFEQDAVFKLSFISEVVKNIRFEGNSSVDNKNLTLILPDFVLCLRDFTVKMKKNGQQIAKNEYLEDGLRTRVDKDETFNKPRECIRNFFPVRTCYTIPPPGDLEIIEKFETLDFNDDSISSRFKEDIESVVSHVYSLKPKQLLNSKPINGEMFTTLASQYVNAIQEGAVLDVDTAFSVVAKKENRRVVQKAKEMFEKEVGGVTLPVPYRILKENYRKAQQLALAYFHKNIVFDNDGKYDRLMKMEISNLWNNIKENNTTKILEMSEDRLEKAYQNSMEEKIKGGHFEVAGGYMEFQWCIYKLEEEYFSTFTDYEKNETWFEFLLSIKVKETSIILADQNKTKKEKEDMERRHREEIRKLITEQEKVQADFLEEVYRLREEQQEKEQNNYEELCQLKLDKEQAEKKLNEFIQWQDKWNQNQTMQLQNIVREELQQQKIQKMEQELKNVKESLKSEKSKGFWSKLFG